MNIDLVSLILGLFAGGAIFGLYLEVRHMQDTLRTIREDQVKRLPHGTLATLEDINAVVSDTRFQNMQVEDVIKALMYSETMRKYQDEGLYRIHELVGDILKNPRKYQDRPNRKRNIV